MLGEGASESRETKANLNVVPQVQCQGRSMDSCGLRYLESGKLMFIPPAPLISGSTQNLNVWV